jgi:hypothetical protein
MKLGNYKIKINCWRRSKFLHKRDFKSVQLSRGKGGAECGQD